MRNLKRIIKIFLNIYWAIRSIFWKRDQSIVLIGSWFGARFADVSRFMFQYLNENKAEVGLNKVVWVTRNERLCSELTDLGYDAYLIGSKESNYYHKHAGFHLINNCSNGYFGRCGDIDTKFSYGAKKVNLWHGFLPMKGNGHASLEYQEKKMRHPVIFKVTEWLNVNSAIFRKMFISPGGWGDCYYLTVTPDRTIISDKMFGLPYNHYIITGNPAALRCLKYLYEERIIIEEIKKHKYSVLYAPTFRKDNSGFRFSEASEIATELIKKYDILWLQKGHYAAEMQIEDNKYNVINLPSTFDMVTIVPFISVLVTDYSGAAGDAMYYDKPIVYYMPDYTEYMENDRGFIIDPEEVIVSKKNIQAEDFLNSLEVALLSEFLPNEKYKEVRKKWEGEKMDIIKIWNDIKQAVL